MLRRLLGILATAIAVVFGSNVMTTMSAGKPNILFVIMDDVDIDLLSAMG